MERKELVENIRRKGSFLCVGLDPDIKKLPEAVLPERQSYSWIQQGYNWRDGKVHCRLQAKSRFLWKHRPWRLDSAWRDRQIYKDKLSRPVYHRRCQKRGDIGNTSQMYARSFFEHMDVDAVTVAPYMGEDSVTPFLGYNGKWVILLARHPIREAMISSLSPTPTENAFLSR